jgi:hypothetical protein
VRRVWVNSLDLQQEPLSVRTRSTVMPWAAKNAFARCQNAAAVCRRSSGRTSL